ncbi:MAG: flagellar basal body P-ring protein FlgI [Balneolaceae bacterium]|nr:MAG: flagellar basal body P-ring protein FlgI [Balneolaceae bacterium]
MEKKGVGIYVLLIVILFLCENVTAQSRIGDLVEIRNASRIDLVGYGLVSGLDRTGDRSSGRHGSVFTVQSIANMLSNFGIHVDPNLLRTRNVAAVMVTASVSPYHMQGSEINVTVSSMGDASSLQGGVLLQTPLINPHNSEIYAYAQGPLIVGGFNAEIPGARISRNQTLTGTIPLGGQVEKGNTYVPDREHELGLILRNPSFTNAQRIAAAVNERFDEQLAKVYGAGLVEVAWPDGFIDTGDLNFFTNLILETEIIVDMPARVVINERTGTIVAGGNVTIGEVLISHGNIQIQTQVSPFVVQPAPFSLGETVQGVIPQVGVTEQAAQNLVLAGDTKVTDLAASLSNLGFSPRDIIAIFQALDQAGALKGKLIVM